MNEDIANLTCSICGKHSEDNPNVVMLRTKDTVICSDCIRRMYDCVAPNLIPVENFEEETTPEDQEREEFQNKLSITPKEIKEHLDQYIIGQDMAKKMLATSVYNHYKKIKMKMNNPNNQDIQEIDKSNALVAGSSGSGKTAIVKHIAKILEVPFTIADITSFSQTGYAGRDVETILRDLVSAADGDIEKAEIGIVYIDEIDKISRKQKKIATSADPAHEAVQQGLLKLIEGSVVDVPKSGARLNPTQDTIKVNTENILFIMSGAFEGIEDIIKKRLGTDKNKIGFGSKLPVSKNKESVEEENKIINQITVEDLKEFGMLPEFLGRTPIVCAVEKLNEETLVRILTEPKNALVKQYQLLFKEDGFDLQFSESALKQIAHEAIERGTGARSLRGVMEKVLGDVMFDLPSLNKEDGLIIYVDTIEAEDEDRTDWHIDQLVEKSEEEK